MDQNLPNNNPQDDVVVDSTQTTQQPIQQTGTLEAAPIVEKKPSVEKKAEVLPTPEVLSNPPKQEEIIVQDQNLVQPAPVAQKEEVSNIVDERTGKEDLDSLQKSPDSLTREADAVEEDFIEKVEGEHAEEVSSIAQ